MYVVWYLLKLLSRFRFYFILLLPVMAYADDLSTDQPVVIDSEVLVELVVNNPEVVIIDVRPRREYLRGHLHDAKNFAISEYLLAEYVPAKYTPIIFYCGGKNLLRSKMAVKKTIEYGYTNVYWFRGGIQEWKAKSMPISFI